MPLWHVAAHKCVIVHGSPCVCACSRADRSTPPPRPAYAPSPARCRSTSKNNAAVVVEEQLDLSSCCNPVAKGAVPPVYQLVGISHHSGSLEGGHYTATVRSASDGSWYHFNDTSVHRDTKPSGPSSSAYVMFYRMAHAS